MARADVHTLGLLNAWPRIMHEDVWRFNQFKGNGVRVTPGCSDATYVQYDRDLIAQALYDAAMLAADYMGFYPAPRWVVDEIIPIRSSAAWNAQTLETKWAHVEAIGRRAATLIQAGATVTFSDEDSDGVQETASVTVTTTVADAEIQAFFRVADGAAGAAHEWWQIEPLTVTDNGNGTKTLKGHKALFAHPKNVWAKEYASNDYLTKFAGDTTQDASHFVTTVDVYRVYADAASAVQLLLDPDVVGAANAVVNATAWLKETRMGYFTLYTASGQSAPSGRPRAVRVSYKAGYPLVANRMDNRLETRLIRFANTLMPQQPNGFCDRTQMKWNDDREVSSNLSQAEADNPPPFGLTNGAIAAWQVVDALRIATKGRRIYAKRAVGST